MVSTSRALPVPSGGSGVRGAQTAQPAPSALASCPNLADPGVCRSPSSRCRPRRRHARPGPVERWRGRKNDLGTQVTVGVPHRSQFRNWLGTGEVGHQETSVSDCSQSFKPALRQEPDLTREQRNLIDAEIGSRPVDKWRRDFANVRSRGGMAFGPRCRRLPLQNPLRHNRIPVAIRRPRRSAPGRSRRGRRWAAGGTRCCFRSHRRAWRGVRRSRSAGGGCQRRHEGTSRRRAVATRAVRGTGTSAAERRSGQWLRNRRRRQVIPLTRR